MASTDVLAAPGGGFYCSTSGTTFASKDALQEHYRSDFHRYNLKRKVAGLPPVTREWFEARKAQLASSDAAKSAAAERVWICPLTKKKFNSEKTYEAHTRSKKYRDLVKKKGLPSPPAPLVAFKSQPQPGATVEAGVRAPVVAVPDGGGYTAKPAVQSNKHSADGGKEAEAMESDGDSGWETASDDEEVEEWDVCRSLFDNHMSDSMEGNLEYMFKNFGFYLPDTEYLEDPVGLLRYLGLKLAAGHVPLHTRGDDAEAKQFQSLHAVQRHMVDTNQCRMAYEGNEEEYEEFYNYDAMEVDDAGGGVGSALAVGGGGGEGVVGAGAGGYELVVGGGGGGDGGGKMIGSREFAQFYKQKPKPVDGRRSVQVGTIVAQYRALGVMTAPPQMDEVSRKAQQKRERVARKHAQVTYMRENVNRNLPRNVPY